MDIDWGKGYEFLDKELQKITSDAELGGRYADKLMKVWVKNVNGDSIETWIALHVEIQGSQDTVGVFEERMYTYNYRIKDRYNVDVVSLAVLTDSNCRYRPNQYQQERWGCRVLFEFLTIKLIDYAADWECLENNGNVFALVVMAHLKSIEIEDSEERKDWKMILTKSLYKRGWDGATIKLLFKFIDWVIKLPAPLEIIYWDEVKAYEKEKRMEYVTTGERIGMQKGEAIILLNQMKEKFGDLTNDLRSRIESADSKTLLKWSTNILKAEKPEDVFH